MPGFMLERGRDVKHGDYPTAMTESWEFEGRTKLPQAELAKQLKQNRTGYTTHPAAVTQIDLIDYLGQKMNGRN